jgi:hypothetical protein
MDAKNRLIELLEEVIAIQKSSFGPDEPTLETVAGYLLANGVIVPPCRIGDTVWVANLTRQRVFPNKVHGIYLAGTSKYSNTMRLEHTNQFGEKSYRKFTWAQFGKNVFFTEEEAEAKLRSGDDNDNLVKEMTEVPNEP